MFLKAVPGSVFLEVKAHAVATLLFGVFSLVVGTYQAWGDLVRQLEAD